MGIFRDPFAIALKTQESNALGPTSGTDCKNFRHPGDGLKYRVKVTDTF